MPNILALTDKVTGERHEGRGLIAVDEKLCAHLGVPVDAVNFVAGWVDWMGLYTTNDWDLVKSRYKESDGDRSDGGEGRQRILNWLSEHYVLGTYAMIGRH